FSRVAGGDGVGEIRLPNHVGIAGTVFTSGETLNIPHAYADLRFNPGFDKKIGYFTQSVLCSPITNKAGEIIGVSQVLNKKGGPFTDEDESRLRAFTTQVAISLENSKLFDDVQNMKNYSDGMLQSMSNGVITLDEEGEVVTCNEAGLKIMSITKEEIIGLKGKEHFVDKNSWIMTQVEEVLKTQESAITMDAELFFAEEKVSANTSVLPLSDPEGKHLGTLIMIEDISSEKRMKSTMSRYMDPGIAEQLLAGGDDVLGGQDLVATLLFSDIRGFTTLTEALGAQGTVKLLNDYFTIMVDCISKEEGMLDKFIGDAIMAAFGVPISHDDDEDRAMRAAITMLTSLEDWNTERKKQGQLPVYMGIGLNTDKIVSGNIGSPKRMDFTMIGDGVNLAARLESACKAYSAKLLISEYTVAKLKGTYQIRDVDNIIVKGKTTPVGVYEVLDYHTDDSFPNLMESVNHFKEARKHYRAGSWDKSIKSFKECLKLNANDTLSQTYIDRVEGLKKNPPKNWDGVLTMTSK
ncbi:MAG TPA: adenylate/guanylate cyclase domain-containing protein, partial [Nitrospinaceae bacterium]|nr:adenylate/guanylate cyclase domain-containing protein [Nitrospinaceae bacterium]